MTGLSATIESNLAGSVREHASKHVFCLIVMVWLVAVLVDAPALFAQNIQFTPSVVSITVPQGGTGTSSLTLKNQTRPNTATSSARTSRGFGSTHRMAALRQSPPKPTCSR